MDSIGDRVISTMPKLLLYLQNPMVELSEVLVPFYKGPVKDTLLKLYNNIIAKTNYNYDINSDK